MFTAISCAKHNPRLAGKNSVRSRGGDKMDMGLTGIICVGRVQREGLQVGVGGGGGGGGGGAWQGGGVLTIWLGAQRGMISMSPSW